MSAARPEAARPQYELVAANMLRRFGLEAVWRLQLSAARAYRDGHEAAALYMAQIADAAEREWQRQRDADLKREASP